MPEARGIVVLLPGDPETRTGGYIYDKRIVDGLRALGRPVTVVRLPDAFPYPDAPALAAARAALAALDDGAVAVVDGLAFSAMPEVVAAEAGRLRLVALIHHPLALETGLDAAQRADLFDRERRALPAARRIVVTSRRTARDLEPYGVAAHDVSAILPGTDPAPIARGSGGRGPVLLCVATVTPRKGHIVLLDALEGLRDRPWRLICAGSLERDAPTARAVQAMVAARDLGRRVEFLGEIAGPALDAAYDGADLFVLPSFHEGYGMAYAEALARGLPVIGTTAGAIPDTVPAAAGLLVAPGDATALRGAIARCLDDPATLASLRRGALAARRDLPDWPAAARAFSAVLDGVA